MKKLGVIGGMGPAATAIFYEMLIEKTPAEKDQQHIPMVILNDCLMPDRTAAILGTDEDRETIFARLLSDALYLKQGGCDALAVPCNTSHFFADRLEKESGIKLLNMPRLTAQAALKKCGKGAKVAVLATDGTVNTGVYQKALSEQGLEAWNPPEDIQKLVMYMIYDKVKAGADYGFSDWKPVEDSVSAAGCSCAVLGCTELSLINRKLGLSEFYVDAMDVLAESCVKEFKE